jgi:hypothetical protein
MKSRIAIKDDWLQNIPKGLFVQFYRFLKLASTKN